MNKEELEKVEQLIEQKDSEQLKDLLAGLHPADIAELCNELDAEEARFIYLLLDNETAADVLIEMDEDARKEFLEILPSETIAKRFVDYMDSDDAVDIIREMDEDKQEEVLSHIEDIEQAGDIVDLLKYDEDTAGGLMGTEMVIVNENWSMPECLKEMRIQAEDMDEIYYVYVVDDDQRLRGVFPLKKMITSPSVSKVKHVMRKEPISVHVDTPIDEVVQTIEKYDLVAVPVVDSIGRLVGRITVDDVMDEVREQAERDYQLASGLSQDVETDDNVFRQTTARLPWLLIGMIGGIGNSMILGNFDSTFAAHPEMALYIPLIGGTGGNVGTQSSALIVQGLANSSLDAQNTWKQIVKESVVAVINATIISMLVYIYNFIRFGASATVTYSVSFSLFAVVMFASIFGTLVPMTLEKLKIDPAIGWQAGYRHFSLASPCAWYMSVSALLSLRRAAPGSVRTVMKENLLHKKSGQPVHEHTAGCVFRNPEGRSAGRLLDQAGMKGRRRGAMFFSPMHANFLVHDVRCGIPGSAADALALIEEAKGAVRERFGVELVMEVKEWGHGPDER